MLDNFLTILDRSKVEWIEKKSLFIGEAIPISSAEEVEVYLADIRKREATATHHVYAYVLTNEGKQVFQRFSDAGEPKGTAGKPILDAILGRKLNNVLVVVTRYFGGTLLGAGGLVRAYSHSAILAIETATMAKLAAWPVFTCSIPYRLFDTFTFQLQKIGGIILEETYQENIDLRFSLSPAALTNWQNFLAELSAGELKIEKVGVNYVQIPIEE